MPTSIHVRRGGESVLSQSKPKPSTSPRLTHTEIADIEDRIKKLHQGVIMNSFQIGAELVRIREEAIPPGQWRSYLAGAQEKFGFSTRTAFRYIEGYERAVNLPSTKLKALEKKGLDPAAPRVLAAV